MADPSAIFQLQIPWRDPLDAFAPLAMQPWAIGFFSSGSNPMSRWSILCAEPDEVFIENGPDALSKLKIPAKMDIEQTDFPFCGGFAGLLGYEFGLQLQNITSKGETNWPDLAFGHYPCCALFDHQSKQAWVVGPDSTKAHQFLQKLGGPRDGQRPKASLQDMCLTETDEQIVAKVKRTISYIKAGDIFQANISREFSAHLSNENSPYDLFCKMVALSQAPFCASFCLDDSKMVLSNSPERFLKLSPTGQVKTHPIKGTRPRSANLQQDHLHREQLLQSAKDRAENLMIVDLMRNDLSRVCKPGSVAVPELFTVQSFANVHHLVSTVCGQIREENGPLDLLRATFPPGSITGAPKIRAMQIINELEQISRGAYCGALGFISNHGAMDFNVLIRTLQLQRSKRGWAVSFRAGGGIVADSDPQSEAQEMCDKASIFFKLSEKN